MRSWEKRTGVSLEEIISVVEMSWGSSIVSKLYKNYLVKTCCWVVDGAGFEEPWPMSESMWCYSRA